MGRLRRCCGRATRAMRGQDRGTPWPSQGGEALEWWPLELRGWERSAAKGRWQLKDSGAGCHQEVARLGPATHRTLAPSSQTQAGALVELCWSHRNRDPELLWAGALQAGSSVHWRYSPAFMIINYHCFALAGASGSPQRGW